LAGSAAEEETMTRLGADPSLKAKRTYKTAMAVDGALLLDGRPAKTRAGSALAFASEAVMAEIEREWRAQQESIVFAAMPITRFAATVIDLGDADAEKWRQVLLSFLRSDLLCYRAERPPALVERQNAAWDPLLDWASIRCGISLISSDGVSHIEQPADAILAGERRFAAASAAELVGMKAAAEIAGSAVIAIALAQGAFAPAALFDASRVDDTFQAECWGADAEAAERTARLRREFLDAGRFLDLLREKPMRA
jgi:chaperone required for assembly of F1-ATPase